MKLKVAAINANVVITATGTAQRADEVAKVVTTLDASEIEAKHELTLTEALRGTPGVRVQQQGSPGALTTLRLRGQRNFDTALLFDGLRVRDAGDINGSALSLFSDLVPTALDRVEILRGAGSSIYGSHAIGGVINLIPDAGSSGFHFSGGFEGGGLATFREHLQASGGGNNFGFNLGVNRLDVRNGIDGDDAYGNTGFIGRAQYNATPSITITGESLRHDRERACERQSFCFAGRVQRLRKSRYSRCDFPAGLQQSRPGTPQPVAGWFGSFFARRNGSRLVHGRISTRFE